jgi:ParB family chromosome partitioning protein
VSKPQGDRISLAEKMRIKKEQIENQTDQKFENVTLDMSIFYIDTDKIKSAPEDWNFYKPLSDSKILELIESILENGLLTPPILWQRENDSYMMLAGHNRLRVYNMIYDKTGDKEFKRIPCYVKKINEITEDEARTIIVDSNFCQRQLSTLEKTKSIVQKYKTMGRKKRNSGGTQTTAEIIAEEYRLTKMQIHRYLKLQYLIPELMNRIDMNTLSMNSGLKLASLSQDVQEKLYIENLVLLNNNSIKNITSTNYEKVVEQLKNCISDYEIVKIKVPLDLEQKLEEYLHTWEHYSRLVVDQ